MWDDTIKPHLKDHRDRVAQDEIFRATINRLASGQQTVALEGGPGTGKSLFASVMAYAATCRGSRLFYVPRTKAQQDMIETETVPRMSYFLPNGYAVLKGRSEYVCLRRAGEAGFTTLGMIGDGTKANYPMTTDDWSLVCSSSDAGCGPRSCGPSDAYNLAKDRAAGATMVITNQSILALNHVLDNKILSIGEHDYLLVDEAHLLPGVMSDALGGHMSVRRLEMAWKAAKDWVPRDLADGLDEAARLLDDQLWAPSEQWTSYSAGETIQELIRPPMNHAFSQLESMFEAHQEQPPKLKGLAFRLQRLYKDAGHLAAATTTHSVVTVAKARGTLVVEARKFAVADESRTMFEGFERTVLMSATMQDLATKLLGVEEPIVGPRPFEVETKRLAYHPTWKPVETGPHQWSEDELRTLVQHSKGGALVIASANTQKERAAEVLRAEGWSVGVQTGGGEDVRRLIAGLKDGTFDVIVGVDSVGTGIDVPGDSLRLVVILSAFNPNAFSDMHLKLWAETFRTKTEAWNQLFTPMCLEKTEQAIGRLLRTPEDRGVVAFLDPRVRPRNQFRSLAAPSPFTGDLDVVKEFFDAR